MYVEEATAEGVKPGSSVGHGPETARAAAPDLLLRPEGDGRPLPLHVMDVLVATTTHDTRNPEAPSL